MNMDEFTTEFVYNPGECYNTVKIPLHLPLKTNAEELVYIYIRNNDLPISKDVEIIQSLFEFISKEEEFFYNVNTAQLIDSVKDDVSTEDVIKKWEKVVREETAEYGEKRCASDEELFATAYHKMVHSPALETMINVEQMYAGIVRQKTEEKSKLVHALSNKQTEEMNKAVDSLEDDNVTESEINDLVAKHCEDHALLIVKLTSEIDTIKEAQRREYREWLMQMLEQNETNSSLPTPKNSPLTPVALEPPLSYSSYARVSETPLLEESFTIHLGSQLKQMHNIRILSANILDLCAAYTTGELSEPTPQLLQTALGLYSSDLYGLLLMTNNKIGSRMTNDFQEICRKSTDCHFPNIDDQLDKITGTLQKHLKERQIEGDGRNTRSELLQMGDFYMTKHSNLSQVHVVFHIVSDESLRGNEINSRHPVVLGLRNILRIACSNDITSVTIPLLLQYEMTEEMTISWCEKRAELIFKCVKGFMIEMASWGGSELKNLQFMLPQGISVQVFQSLTEMLPKIFKVSNPKVLK